MALSSLIVSVLLKHGPLHVADLLQIVDPDDSYYGYDEKAGFSFHVPQRIVWELIDRGVLAVRQDRMLAVMKKEAVRFLYPRG